MFCKTQIRRSFKAPVTETTWNFQRRRKQALNTKQTFWNDNAAEQTFNKLISVWNRKLKPYKEPKHDYHKPKELEMEIRKPSQKHMDINPKHSALGTFFLVGN